MSPYNCCQTIHPAMCDSWLLLQKEVCCYMRSKHCKAVLGGVSAKESSVPLLLLHSRLKQSIADKSYYPTGPLQLLRQNMRNMSKSQPSLAQRNSLSMWNSATRLHELCPWHSNCCQTTNIFPSINKYGRSPCISHLESARNWQTLIIYCRAATRQLPNLSWQQMLKYAEDESYLDNMQNNQMSSSCYMHFNHCNLDIGCQDKHKSDLSITFDGFLYWRRIISPLEL